MGAGIPADGTRSDNSYLSSHAFLPFFRRLARRLGTSQGLTALRQALGVIRWQAPFIGPSAGSCTAAIDAGGQMWMNQGTPGSRIQRLK
jgi:hypothetical protein